MFSLALLLFYYGAFRIVTVSPQDIESICDVDSEAILFDDEKLEKLRATFRNDGGCVAVDWKFRFDAVVRSHLREERALDSISDKDKRVLDRLSGFERRRSHKSRATLRPPALDGRADADIVFVDNVASIDRPSGIGVPPSTVRPYDRNTRFTVLPSQQQRQTTERPSPPEWATPASPCVRRCPNTPEYNPICGKDGVTYKNPGDLRCARLCGRDVSLWYYGTCVTTTSRPLTPITSSSVNLIRLGQDRVHLKR